MIPLELFPGSDINEQKRLYIIGNGFDIHHGIKSKYWNFKEWVLQNKKVSDLVDLMDVFFSNDHEFWGDIENALGEYDEVTITDYCEPENPEDFKYDHPGQWQDGVEGSIPWIFGRAMEKFHVAFDEWVQSIDINNVEAVLCLPPASKYLTFNYIETLERVYSIPAQNVLHIHGSRLNPSDEFILGHGNFRNEISPLLDERIELPYQNAYSEVIKIMNGWRKSPKQLIEKNNDFFQSLRTCVGVCVLGLSYNEIDMPYLDEVVDMVDSNCEWLLYFYSEEDKQRATAFANNKGLVNFRLLKFE